MAGLSAAMLGFFRGAFDPSPQTTIIVLVGLITGVALGPWLPQGLIRFFTSRAAAIAARAPRRGRRQPLVLLTAAAPEANEDRRLLLASSCLLGALAILFVAVMADPIRALCEWLRTDFLWVPAVLRLTDLLVATAVHFVPASLLGVALVCSLGMGSDSPMGRAVARHIAAVALGLGLGLSLFLWWFRFSVGSLLILLVSSVPPLVAVMIALLSASGADPKGDQARRVGTQPGQSAGTFPELGGSGLGLLLAALAVWALSLALAGAVWHEIGLARPATYFPPAAIMATWLVSIAVGVRLGVPRAEAASQTLGAGGIRLCMAGLGTALAVSLICATPPLLAVSRGTITGRSWPLWLAIGVHGIVGGFALPAILRAALSRFATRGLAHAVIVTTIAVAVMVGLVPSGLRLLTGPRTLIAACLACLFQVIAGGILVIYDPLDARRSHRRKLFAVFASLLLLILVLPRAALSWPLGLRGVSAGPEAFDDSGARAASTGTLPAGPLSPEDSSAMASQSRGVIDRLLSLCPRGSKVCLIGGELKSLRGLSSGARFAGLRIDHWPHQGDLSVGRQLASLARLRVAHQRYDLIILGPAGQGVRPNRDLWTLETLRRVAGLAAPKGLVVVRIPTTDLRAADIQTVAQTFRSAFRGHGAWFVYGGDGRLPDELWLLGLRGPQTSGLLIASLAAGGAPPAPIRDLLAGTDSPKTHSAEHPRLRGATPSASSQTHAEIAGLLTRAGS
ncbi:MAG: hypothetical protein JSU68_12170 [Phycisphaerales bacterium]|nr:MAG: hypothetical protein JSU68_12170 [Phycisphaerales bacterium]